MILHVCLFHSFPFTQVKHQTHSHYLHRGIEYFPVSLSPSCTFIQIRTRKRVSYRSFLHILLRRRIPPPVRKTPFSFLRAVLNMRLLCCLMPLCCTYHRLFSHSIIAVYRRMGSRGREVGWHSRMKKKIDGLADAIRSITQQSIACSIQHMGPIYYTGQLGFSLLFQTGETFVANTIPGDFGSFPFPGPLCFGSNFAN